LAAKGRTASRTPLGPAGDGSPRDITDELFRTYGPLLDDRLSRALVLDLPDGPAVECHFERGTGLDVQRRDVPSSIVEAIREKHDRSGETLNLATMITDLDPMDLLNATPIFSEPAGKLIEDIYRRDSAPDRDRHRKRRAVNVARHRLTSGDVGFKEIREEIGLPETVTDVVAVHELQEGFVLTNVSRGYLYEIEVEDDSGPDGSSADYKDYADYKRYRDEYGPYSYAIITKAKISELAFDDGIIIGYRYSPPAWTRSGPEIVVRGRTDDGKVFDQRFGCFLP
jgi:hypothetical protein